VECRLSKEGFDQGSCQVFSDGGYKTACEVTLKWEKDTPHRLIHSYAHKAPEQYLSIYQSGCNWSCKKCHSWRFSKNASGSWMSPEDIAKVSHEYATKNRENMVEEPRDHATSWHAQKLCRNCGSCILRGERSEYCPGEIKLDQITCWTT